MNMFFVTFTKMCVLEKSTYKNKWWNFYISIRLFFFNSLMNYPDFRSSASYHAVAYRNTNVYNVSTANPATKRLENNIELSYRGHHQGHHIYRYYITMHCTNSSHHQNIPIVILVHNEAKYFLKLHYFLCLSVNS